MRRILFYLSVALVAFGVGSFVVFKIYWNDKSAASKSDETSATLPDDSKNLKIFEDNGERKKSRYICSDEDILNLRRQLESTGRFEAEKYLSERMNIKAVDCSEIYKIERLDLNDDGTKEIVVTGVSSDSCSTRGNCDLWIFRKTENDYQMILYDAWAFNYKFQAKKANGYKVLQIIMNSTGSPNGPANYLDIWHFNGQRYQKKKCFSREWKKDYKETELKRSICDENEG